MIVKRYIYQTWSSTMSLNSISSCFHANNFCASVYCASFTVTLGRTLSLSWETLISFSTFILFLSLFFLFFFLISRVPDSRPSTLNIQIVNFLPLIYLSLSSLLIFPSILLLKNCNGIQRDSKMRIREESLLLLSPALSICSQRMLLERRKKEDGTRGREERRSFSVSILVMSEALALFHSPLFSFRSFPSIPFILLLISFHPFLTPRKFSHWLIRIQSSGIIIFQQPLPPLPRMELATILTPHLFVPFLVQCDIEKGLVFRKTFNLE